MSFSKTEVRWRGVESLPGKKLILNVPLCQLPASQVGLIKTYFQVLILKIYRKTGSHQNTIYTKLEVQKVHGSLQGFKKQREP